MCDSTEDHMNGPSGDTWLVCCGTPYCYGNAFTLDNSFHSRAHACEAWNNRTPPTSGANGRDEPDGGDTATKPQN